MRELRPKETTFIGVDTAEVAGFAYYFPFSNEATVFEYKGTPLEQWELLIQMIERVSVPSVSFEELHNFNYPRAVRPLFERYGFLKWSALGLKFYSVKEVHPMSARSLLKCKTKAAVLEKMREFTETPEKLTNNHTDALAVAIYTAYKQGHFQDGELPKIQVKELQG